jgi:hypothetical protein
MATLIDIEENGRLEDEDNTAEELDALDSQEQPSEEDELPDKYRGKSASDLVRMHQEAERMLGRQSGEVGELRKVVDEFVMSQSTKKEETVDEEIDYFSDPEKAIQQAIAKHPAVQEAQKASLDMKKSSAQTMLKQKHPDMAEILTDEKFASWVGESKFRTNLLRQADQNFDYEAADEIFNLWKERQNLIGQTVNAEKSSRNASVRAASTGGASGTSETSSKKIFRRADIIKLMKDNPDRYAAMSDEIMLAYQEGRVK